MSGFVMPLPRQRFFDTDGNPLASGRLYVYLAGTSTPATVYTDQALTVPHSNPIVLDAAGEATIYVEDGTLYKFVLKTSADVQLWSVDNVAVPEVAAAPAAQAVPTGGIIAYGGAAAPSGYLLCDGSVVSRTTFSALFTAIGTAYGAGDGSTTFGIPDLRQKFPMGLATSGTGNALGQTGGNIDHVHTGPSHQHDVTVSRDSWGDATNTPPIDGRLKTGDSAGTGVEATAVQATTDRTFNTGASGTGNTGTANPPFQVVNYIIKT